MTSSMKSGLIGCTAGLAIGIILAVGYFSMNGKTPTPASTDTGSPITTVATAGDNNVNTGTNTIATNSDENSSTGKTGNSGSSGSNGSTIGTTETVVPTPMKTVEKKSIPESAVDRLVSRTMKGEFQMTGRGKDKKWGISEEANFVCTVIVVADSKIKKKDVLSGGKIQVTEIRSFKTVQDSVVVSDVDMRLALDTIPISTFSSMIDAAAIGWATLTGDAVSAAIVKSTKDYVEEKLMSVDGISARNLLGMVGIKPPEEIEKKLSDLANAHFRQALGGIRSISGKSYEITYAQDKTGQPLYVDFKYENGDDILDEEEQMVLKRVNAFIDYNMVPNRECEPGDTWKIDAGDMQEVFDPYVDGNYSGVINVMRQSDNPNGDWSLQLLPGVINIINDNNNTTGHLNLRRGTASVDPKLISVNDLFASGSAKIEKVSRHHWLFTAKISGECEFQGKLVTTPNE